MLFSRYGQAILTLHERHSRLLIAVRPQSKAALPIAQAIADILEQMPAPWRQTVTFDNGTEFAYHYHLHALNIETFFCDTYSPWQKGGVENAIGRMRRVLPRKTDLAAVSDDQFVELVQAYNNTPRKCLDFRTPAVRRRRIGENCCTSNVNPPSSLRRNDINRGMPMVSDGGNRPVGYPRHHRTRSHCKQCGTRY